MPSQPVNKISHIHDERIVMKIKAPPDKGKANKELIVFMAKSLGVSRSLVSVIQGQTSHLKLITLPLSASLALKNCIANIEKS
ncbi:MAG: DUF167 domain-containing protein [Spirochaetaceae bacterium]|nr:MAG: DUF167 domain-containing protein [Spirochaetaceae bacterium]